MPNYYPPAGGAGGGGTPDDNSVTSAKIVDGAILNADINASAAIAYSKLALTGAILNADLAGSIAYSKLSLGSSIVTGDITDGTILGGDLSSTIAIPSGATGTTQSANDNSTKVATTAYTDTADALKANLAGPTFTGSPVLPTGTTGTTQASSDSSTKLATTAYVRGYVDAGVDGWYCNFVSPTLATGSSAMAANNDYRFLRVTMAKTGTLHDVYCLINTTGGNGNILVLDDGQANATHTVRTVLAVKGSTGTPAGGSYLGFDPALAVNAGDTLMFACTFDGTTAKIQSISGGSGSGTLPSTSFFPGSGASTANQKICGTITAASLTATVNQTVTDANCATAAAMPMFVWRIS